MVAHPPEIEDRLYTIDEFAKLPEDRLYRYELVRGRLVREPPVGSEHGIIQVNLPAELRAYVRDRGLGVVMVETGCVLSEEGPTVRGPDVSFISRERIPTEGLPRGFLRIPPDLAVEIISPSNTAADIQEKIEEYFDAGVRQVWIVYPRTRNVAVHLSRTEVRVLEEDEELEGGDVIPGFRLRVGELFED